MIISFPDSLSLNNADIKKLKGVIGYEELGSLIEGKDDIGEYSVCCISIVFHAQRQTSELPPLTVSSESHIEGMLDQIREYVQECFVIILAYMSNEL